MDSTLIAYSTSFIAVLAILYWKMHKQIKTLLQKKQQGIQDAFQTAEYMNTISVTALHEEAEKTSRLADDAEMIRASGRQQIELLFHASCDFQENLSKQLEQELDEHIQQINGQFLQAMKDEVSELIVARLQDKLVKSIPSRPPVEQFMESVRTIRCA